MRESQTNKFSPTDLVNGSLSEAKSLFRNILATSPCGSRFCPDSAIPRAHKSLGMSILGKMEKKHRQISDMNPGRLGYSVGLGEQSSQAIPRNHLGAAARASSRHVISWMCS
jgi:hypothetical protein